MIDKQHHQQHQLAAMRPAINLAKNDLHTLDNAAYMDIAHRVFQLSQASDEVKIAITLSVAGRVIHNLHVNMTWGEFCNRVIQIAHPSLEPVAVFMQLQQETSKSDLDATLEEIGKYATQANPTASPAELQQHTFAALLIILSHNVSDHFTLHDPVGFERDI